jgi:hypothetical protein
MGLRSTSSRKPSSSGVTRHTEEAYCWVESFAEPGFREVIRDGDRPWSDYAERAYFARTDQLRPAKTENSANLSVGTLSCRWVV